MQQKIKISRPDGTDLAILRIEAATPQAAVQRYREAERTGDHSGIEIEWLSDEAEAGARQKMRERERRREATS